MDRWEYLITKEYTVRHAVAEHFINGLDEVVDIGTYKRKLNFNGKLHSIDPLKTFDDTFHGTVNQWKDLYFNQITGRLGVVILGFDIEGGEDEMQAVISLVNKAKIAVIDVPIQHRPSIVQSESLFAKINKKSIVTMSLVLPQMDTPGFPSYNIRNIHILKGE